MRRHAKASTAGSTQRQATGLGRIFGGAAATHGDPPRAKRSGAPKARRLALPVGLLAAIIATLTLLSSLAGAAMPSVITEPATNLTTTSATLNGTVNPEGEELSQCLFEYGKTTTYGQSAPCAESSATIGNGTGPVAVHADISGLDKASTYHFRLIAVNPSGTAEGADQTLQTLGPVIKGTWTEDVVFKEATLRAEINPAANGTTYYFEWGTDATYGNSSSEASVGSDSSDHKVSFFLEGLQPGTTYHYRVVATNSDAVNVGGDHTFTTYEPVLPDTDCPNQAFRVGASANLPDCRAYEMITPLDKNGGDIISLGTIANGNSAFTGGDTGLHRASVNGDKLTYTSGTAFGDQPSSRWANQYLATRGPNGWSTNGLNPPLGASIFDKQFAFNPVDFSNHFKAVTEDLSSTWVIDPNTIPLTPQGQKGFLNLYRRDNLNDTFRALTVNQPALSIHPSMGLEFKGYSEDLSHQVFNAGAALTPDAASTTNRQVYDFTNDELELVSILPNGEANPQDSIVGSSEFSVNDTFPHYRRHNVDRAVSEDGSRIFWTSRPAEFGALYVRIDGETTVRVSDVADGSPRFKTASTDGSEVVYSAGEFLYEFDVDSETRSLIAEKARGVVGASEDLSYLYFVSFDDLAAGATAGQPNLYLRHEGVDRFIATDSFGVFNHRADSADPFIRASRVTPDGHHVVFMSNGNLTGYDNTDAVTGGVNEEVFRYDADADQLTCVSCNPSGTRPVGGLLLKPWTGYNETAGEGHRAAAWIPTWEHETHGPRVLSDDGDRIFFNSFDKLVPEDTNGAQDVYQWEAQGSGSCQGVDGCISLVSTGQSPKPSKFIDASADGSETFFSTESSIDPSDPGLIDIYVARVGGGYPLPPELTPCVGDACQSIPAAPQDSTPASASFRGAGDPAPRKPRRNCRARGRKATKLSPKAKRKQAKRCRRANRRAAR